MDYEDDYTETPFDLTKGLYFKHGCGFQDKRLELEELASSINCSKQYLI